MHKYTDRPLARWTILGANNAKPRLITVRRPAVISAMTLATLPDDHAQIRPIWRGEPHSRYDRTRRIESIALSDSYSPFGML